MTEDPQAPLPSGRRRAPESNTETPPEQSDFALVTINESEDQAVRDVFGEFKDPQRECRIAGNRGVYEWWQMRGRTPEDQYVVIHASTGDAKGPLPAIELIRELDKLFRPRFLLVLGTAGGIRERGMEYGRVIFSRQVHVGYQQLLDVQSGDPEDPYVGVALFDDPVQPPSDRLYLHAKNVALSWAPEQLMTRAAEEAVEAVKQLDGGEEAHKWIADVLSNLERSRGRRPDATEIFSGSYLIDGQRSQLFKTLKRTFPKVGAVEMEAGAVAQAVLYSIETERFVGYLVVKGISDIVDSNVPAEHRKSVRRTIAKFASVASASFAKTMIEHWSGATGQPPGQLSLLPARYLTLLNAELPTKRHSNSLIYEGVSLHQYSALLQRLCRNRQAVSAAWSFSYLAPYRFFAALDLEDARAEPRSKERILQVAKAALDRHRPDELRSLLLARFPHFRVFRDLAEDAGDKVVRVMHMGPNWEAENGPFLEAFADLIKGVPCFMIDDEDLDSEDWIRRDQVVLNNDLLFDFAEEDRRLVVTHLDRPGLGADFRRFRDHCNVKAREKTFESRLGHWKAANRPAAKKGAKAGG